MWIQQTFVFFTLSKPALPVVSLYGIFYHHCVYIEFCTSSQAPHRHNLMFYAVRKVRWCRLAENPWYGGKFNSELQLSALFLTIYSSILWAPRYSLYIWLAHYYMYDWGTSYTLYMYMYCEVYLDWLKSYERNSKKLVLKIVFTDVCGWSNQLQKCLVALTCIQHGHLHKIGNI